MATSRNDIIRWFKEALARGATHMIVFCDTWDYDDYPVYVMPGQDCRSIASKPPEMARLMEVYAMHLPMETQMAEGRALHYDLPLSMILAKTPVKTSNPNPMG